jgi:hypothetical protein
VYEGGLEVEEVEEGGVVHEASLGGAVSLELSASARGQGGSAAVRTEMSPVLARAARV